MAVCPEETYLCPSTDKTVDEMRCVTDLQLCPITHMKIYYREVRDANKDPRMRYFYDLESNMTLEFSNDTAGYPLQSVKLEPDQPCAMSEETYLGRSE